jgi:hypothetical protein
MQDGQPLAPERSSTWAFRADGTADVAFLGRCVWESDNTRLTLEPRPARPALRRVGPLRVEYEIVLLTAESLELRNAPDEQMRRNFFGPAISPVPPDSPALSRKSLRAGLVSWKLKYPSGRTGTVYMLPDEGQDAVADMLATVERSLLSVGAFKKVAGTS